MGSSWFKGTVPGELLTANVKICTKYFLKHNFLYNSFLEIIFKILEIFLGASAESLTPVRQQWTSYFRRMNNETNLIRSVDYLSTASIQ